MRLGGLQKLTLLDFPGHVACTVFTLGCNFRCPFCHNAALVARAGEQEVLSETVFFDFLEKRRGLLDGVAVTGGEPLLQPDIADFLAEIRSRGYAVKLDTNGSYPERLADILTRGLADYVAMDIKNSPAAYEKTAGVDALDRCRESITLLRESGVPHEFRTTAVAELHTAEDFSEIGRMIAGEPHYYIQQFKDSGDILAGGMTAPTEEQMKDFLRAVQNYVPAAELRGI